MADPSPSIPRLTPGGAAVMFVDQQTGIADLPGLTVDIARLRRAVNALAQIAKIFELPAVVSAVPNQDGTQPTVFSEIVDNVPTAPILTRSTTDSFADEAIRAVLERTGRRTLLVSGVLTEVAVQLPSISAAAAGYEVFVVLDACAGAYKRSEDAAIQRMGLAGIAMTSIPGLIGELAGDFSRARGQAAIGVLYALLRGVPA